MRHIFILNPAAGREDKTERERSEIIAAAARCGIEPEIYETEYKGHATELTKKIAASTDEVCRFYSCGGDGTLYEVVNGVADCPNAQVACYPSGTGNDFVKIFTDTKAFLNFDNLINGRTVPIDVIDCGGYRSINIFSTGIDARVANYVGEFKRKVPAGGKLPYNLALVKTFFQKLNRYYEVEIDGKRCDGDYYIIVAASGRYYGGGYYALPEAEPDDGMLDFLLVKDIGRLEILKKIGYYQKGQHDRFGDDALYVRGREMKLRSRDKEPLNTDGEIHLADECDIKLAKDRLMVVVPEGVEIIHNAKTKETAKI